MTRTLELPGALRRLWRPSAVRVDVALFLISVLLGVFLVVVTDEKTILGFAVATIGTVAGLQLQTMSELRRRAERQDQFSRFLASVEDVPSLLTDLSEIAAAACVALAPDQRAVYRDQGQAALNRAKAELKGIEHGHLEVAAGDGVVLRSVFRAAQRSIWAATAFPGQLEFWGSWSGAYYLDMHKALTGRVTITRYFMVDASVRGNKDLETELDRVLQAQVDAGVNVARVDSAQLAPELYSPVVMIDRELVQEAKRSEGGELIGFRYSSNAADIDRVARQLNRIAAVAQPWPPPAPGVGAGGNGTS